MEKMPKFIDSWHCACAIRVYMRPVNYETVFHPVGPQNLHRLPWKVLCTVLTCITSFWNSFQSNLVFPVDSMILQKIVSFYLWLLIIYWVVLNLAYWPSIVDSHIRKTNQFWMKKLTMKANSKTFGNLLESWWGISLVPVQFWWLYEQSCCHTGWKTVS